MPVSRLVQPGPAVTRHTPGSPLSCALAAAMLAAACSWRTSTCVISGVE